jgi:hypothetical protein
VGAWLLRLAAAIGFNHGPRAHSSHRAKGAGTPLWNAGRSAVATIHVCCCTQLRAHGDVDSECATPCQEGRQGCSLTLRSSVSVAVKVGNQTSRSLVRLLGIMA